MAINANLERQRHTLVRDTRSFEQKAATVLRDPKFAAFGPLLMLAFVVTIPAFAEVFAAVGTIWYLVARRIHTRGGLPMYVPKVANMLDPKEERFTAELKKGAGIIYVGTDRDSGEEVWMTDTQARTHMMWLGTTGSGKTQALASLAFASAITQGSGLIYVDGKADSNLYAMIYSLARAMGREDDILCVNFQTGAKDIFGAQASKMSNTMNSFSVGSSGMLSELVKSLLVTGTQDIWTERAISFVEAIMKPLVYLRDHHGFNLDVGLIREFFSLDKIEELAWVYPKKYDGLEQTLDGVRAYLKNLPSYDQKNMGKHGETVQEQHGYISMQLVRTFSSLADTYGYIMKTPLAEIDFVDVFLNRRILLVMLPALEKSPPELTNLGRIIVASIKAVMAVGLGAEIEGDREQLIDNKPTNSPSPFPCILDEYGYYSTPGFAVVPAQARSLGFSAIFAGQDLPGFEKSSKEEAASTLANTNTKFFGFLTCVQTYRYINDLIGEGEFAASQGYEGRDGVLNTTLVGEKDARITRMSRIHFDDLKGQGSGQWYVNHKNWTIKLKSFYANPTQVKRLRVNHYIPVARPAKDEVAAFRQNFDDFNAVLQNPNGLHDAFDSVPAWSLNPFIEAIEANVNVEPITRIATAVASMVACETRQQRDLAAAMNTLEEESAAVEEESSCDTQSFDGTPSGEFDIVALTRSLQAPAGSTSVETQAMSSPDPQSVGHMEPEADEDVAAPYEIKAQRFPSSTSHDERVELFTPPTEEDEYAEGIFAAPEDNFSGNLGMSLIGDLDDHPAAWDIEPNQGLLNRAETVSSLSTINRALGLSAEEADLGAAVTAAKLATATNYPLAPLPSQVLLEDATKTANSILEALSSPASPRHHEAVDRSAEDGDQWE